jgi:single-strand DNA-binding protein
MNSVILLGRLSREPELRFIPSSGMAVAKMNLAVDREMTKDKKEQAKQQGGQTADFVNITIFGKQAENVCNFLAKGSKCAIHGRINTGTYTTPEGEKRYSTDVIADRVEFLDSKADRQAPRPVDDGSFFDDGEDVFQPVDNMDDVPF